MFPWKKWIIPLISYIICVVLYLFRGTKDIKSFIGVKPCSIAYWLLFVIPFIIASILTLIQARIIVKEYKRRVKIGFPFCESDIIWTKQYLLILPILGFIMGLLSSSLGIGGGLVLGPVLINLISNPLISTASSNALVVITSSSSTMQFAILGKLNFGYAVFCLFATISGSLLGSFFIDYIVHKTGRKSYVIIALAITCAVSTLTIPIQSTFDMIKRSHRGFSLFEFGNIC